MSISISTQYQYQYDPTCALFMFKHEQGQRYIRTDKVCYCVLLLLLSFSIAPSIIPSEQCRSVRAVPEERRSSVAILRFIVYAYKKKRRRRRRGRVGEIHGRRSEHRSKRIIANQQGTVHAKTDNLLNLSSDGLVLVSNPGTIEVLLQVPTHPHTHMLSFFFLLMSHTRIIRASVLNQSV